MTGIYKKNEQRRKQRKQYRLPYKQRAKELPSKKVEDAYHHTKSWYFLPNVCSDHRQQPHTKGLNENPYEESFSARKKIKELKNKKTTDLI